MRFGGMDFFKGGTKAALSTWSGDVWVVSGIDETLEKLTWKRFAAGLFQPLGFGSSMTDLRPGSRWDHPPATDLNGDGEADFYAAFNHDVAVTTGFHEFAMDLQTDPEGNFYFAKAGPVKGGGRGFDYHRRQQRNRHEGEQGRQDADQLRHRLPRSQRDRRWPRRARSPAATTKAPGCPSAAST